MFVSTDGKGLDAYVCETLCVWQVMCMTVSNWYNTCILCIWFLPSTSIYELN